MHSTASDGTDRPESLPQLAKDAGLSAIALTDHDTTAGLTACAAAAEAVGIAFVPGIELSADPGPYRPSDLPPERGTLHILGYFIQHDDPQLQKLATWLHQAREQRNPEVVAKLHELGVKIDYEDVVAAAGGGIVGRPHIAQVMVQKGYVKSIHEAFARYIGGGGAAHIRKDRLSATDAIEAIHHAGGVAVLAHPVQLGLPDRASLQRAVSLLKDEGLDGIEVRHSDHTPQDIAFFDELAQRFDLLTTGGSDYHGSRKAVPMGASNVPMTVYETLADGRKYEVRS